MVIRKVQVGRINAAAYNPRVQLKPGDPAYEKLKRSINEFGFVEPLVWNERTRNLVGGHQRLNVLKDLGYETVDAVVVDLPIEQEKALNVALNQIRGDWDERKLAELLDELTKVPQFDVELSGFEMPEIKELIASVLETSDEAKEEDFDPVEMLRPEEPAVTKPG